MPEVEVTPPEIDVDERATPFKRAVAVVVVTLTLFASIVAYLQTAESNKEDRAAREAQRFATTGLGAQVDASADFQRAYSVYTQSELLDRRRIIAVNRQRQAVGTPSADVFALAAERAAAVKQAIAATSPLVSDEEFNETGDPNFPNRFDAEVSLEPDEARLRQTAQAELANGHGEKADTFVAILTVLAVALFLLGLSLTVEGRSRRLLVVPGVGIAVVCLGWTALTVLRDVPRTPERAIRAVADGNRLVTRFEFDEAIEAYTTAIEERSDYAAAFGARAGAQFLAGSPQASAGFVSITDEEHLAAAIEDSERSIELGGGDDVSVVGGLGFYHFLAGDFDAAARLTDQALDLNDRLPSLWWNAGLIEVARGDDDAAESFYDIGLDLVEDEPDEAVRSDLFSAARVDLGIARDLGADDDLVSEFEAFLAGAETELRLPDAGEPSGGASVDDLTIERGGVTLFLDGTQEGLDDGAPLTTIWYFRDDGDLPFSQPPGMNTFEVFEDDGSGTISAVTSNGLCLPSGEYRAEVFSGDQRLGTASIDIEPGTLGEQVDDRSETLGVEVCRPADWTAQEDDELGTLDLTSPDDVGALVSIGVFPVAAERRADPGIVESTITAGASAFGDLDGPPVDDQVGNLTALTAFSTGDDFVGSVSGALDADGVMRIVSILAVDSDTLERVRNELLPGMFFLGVAE